MKTFTIIVPASSANIGPCFDSGGLALNRYLTLNVTRQERWEFVHKSYFLPSISDYNDHFIYQMAERIATRYQQQLPACHVTVTSDIPLARGLGSSASAILAGIELANQLCDLGLTDQDKLELGTEIEGHPDNIAASLYGGIVLSLSNNHQDTTHFRLPPINMELVVFIPTTELKTKAARSVLPETYTRREASGASAVGNMMIAALVSGDYTLAGEMMEQDLFHEPYRAELIPHYDAIRKKAKEYGAYSTVISGAGPTLISFVPQGNGDTIAKQMGAFLSEYQVASLTLDTDGVSVT